MSRLPLPGDRKLQPRIPEKIPHYSCPKHDFYILKRSTLRGVSVGYVCCLHCTYITTMTHRTLQSRGIFRGVPA